MQIKLKETWLYTKADSFISSFWSMIIRKLMAYCMYVSLYELPISLYMEIKRTGETKKLQKKLKRLPLKTSELWKSLSDEFAKLIGGHDYISRLLEYRDYLYRVNEVNILTAAWNLYEMGVKDGADVLKMFGLKLETAHSAIRRKITSMNIVKAKMDAEYAMLNSDKEDNFFATVVRVNKSVGYQHDLSTTSCMEWIEAIKLIKELNKNGK